MDTRLLESLLIILVVCVGIAIGVYFLATVAP